MGNVVEIEQEQPAKKSGNRKFSRPTGALRAAWA